MVSLWYLRCPQFTYNHDARKSKSGPVMAAPKAAPAGERSQSLAPGSMKHIACKFIVSKQTCPKGKDCAFNHQLDAEGQIKQTGTPAPKSGARSKSRRKGKAQVAAQQEVSAEDAPRLLPQPTSGRVYYAGSDSRFDELAEILARYRSRVPDCDQKAGSSDRERQRPQV